MERSYNGVKDENSQWMDAGQSKVKVWEWVRHCSDHKKMGTVSNSLSQISGPRLIGSISSMIGQTTMCKWIDASSQKYNTSYDIWSCDGNLKLDK